MSLDIMIVNFHTPHDLDRCLASLVKFAPTCSHTVTIVNNEATPDDDHIALSYSNQYDHWRTWSRPDNAGYATACNDAAILGMCDVLAFFNADVEFTYGLLDACHDALLNGRSQGWGILGPRQVNRAGQITHGGIFGTLDKPQIRGWKQRGDQYQDVRDDAVSVSGSAYFIRRDLWWVLTDCGMYQRSGDTRYSGAFLPTFHYYEETWCSYHAQHHGWKVVYWGLHTMIHEWHQASPVGGIAEKGMPKSREQFRRACEIHGIPCD